MTNPIITAISAVFGITDFGNVLTWAMGIMTGLAVAIIIYGGVLYTASGGNKSLTEEGKKWIVAAISGIVILILAYIMLNTINPEVLRINNAPLPPINVTPAGQTAPVNTSPNVQPASGSAEAQLLAQQILNDPNITLDSSGECDSNVSNPGNGSSNPLANIVDTSKGLLPYVCAVPNFLSTGVKGSCDCTRGAPYGKTSLNPNLLAGLLQVANNGFKFDITSLASGIHGGSCNQGSCFSYRFYHGHYSGEAVDLVPLPVPQTPGDWLTTLNEISSISPTYCGSGTVFYCESNSIVEPDCQVPATNHIHWTCAK